MNNLVSYGYSCSTPSELLKFIVSVSYSCSILSGLLVTTLLLISLYLKAFLLRGVIKFVHFRLNLHSNHFKKYQIMKNVIALLFTLLTLSYTHAQDIAGQWHGVLEVQGTQLRLVFNITKTANGISATMDSPDQGAKDIPVTTASFENPVLKIAIPKMGLEYEGKLDKDKAITGTFKQGGLSLPLNLSKNKIERAKIARAQEPTKPYPYYAEDVVFENKNAQITLAGTLTLPKKEGKYPVVVLITGSGPQNRDEEIVGHKPFLVLADHLTKNGIGVLRFDDRGTAASKGNFKTATTPDFATDVEAAVNYLLTRPDVDPKKIGLIGHSEGGIIAPIVAAKSKDVSFIVLLAGTGIPGDELLLMQIGLIAKAEGQSDTELEKARIINKSVLDIVVKSKDSTSLKNDLTAYLQSTIKANPDAKPKEMTEEDFIKSEVNTFTSPWMQYFLKYNPSPILADVKCPVLALNGEKDLQVPPKINLEGIKRGLEKGKNTHVTTKELPNLNHLFQECTTGSPNEYAKIEQTFSPIALDEIVNWVLKQVK
jgi:uncharacterized protein